jgi:predicted secreted protein
MSMLQFDEHSGGTEIELHVGEEFVIVLSENPTTGFRWRPISSGEPVCSLLDHSFESVGSSPGRAGSHSWRFRAVKVGVGTIEFAYSRSWEQDRPPAQSFTLGVKVRT